VTGAIQLGGGGKTGRARTDDDDFLAGTRFRRIGQHPTLFETMIDDAVLDILDGDRRTVEPEHTRSFAGRGTYAARKLGKVIGLVQTIESVLPEASIHQVVPFGN
jgi:hypothetical protein